MPIMAHDWAFPSFIPANTNKSSHLTQLSLTSPSMYLSRDFIIARHSHSGHKFCQTGLGNSSSPIYYIEVAHFGPT